MSDPAVPPPLDELLAQRLWVRALARRLVADDARADDVEQTAWLAAIERPPRSAGAARGWLTVVLRNAARKLGRAEGRRARHESAAPLAAGRGEDVPADELVAAAELQQRVACAVLALDEPYRTAVLLRFYDDLTPGEIARRLGVPVDTVRTRVRRGLEKLRARLDHDHGGDRAAWAVPLVVWDASDGGAAPGRSAPVSPGAASSGGAAAGVVGGVAMGLGKKLALAAAVLLVVAGGVAVVRSIARSGGADTAAATGDEGVQRRPQRRAPRAASSPAAVGDDAIPEPVDLGLCDRDLDLHATVIRTDGTPVEGARVAAVAYPWRRVMSLHRHDEAVAGPGTRTARDGTFALRLARGALVSLCVTAPGLVDAERSHCQAGERVRIVLAPGVRLRIEAVDEAGAPRGSVRFRVFNNDGTDPFVVSREATTDASGAATVPDLPPSMLVFVGLLTDGIGDPSWTSVNLPESGEVTRRVVLPAGRTIRGRVTDAETGAPLAAACVGLGWQLLHAVTTDADGRFTYLGWTDGGDGGLDADAEGYVRSTAFVRSSDVADFVLRPGFAATGRILAADGAPAPGAFVTLVAAARNESGMRLSRGHAVAGADGAFRIAGLDREMAHDLVAYAPGHGRILRAVSSPESGDLALGDVVLPAPQEFAGRVVDARGEPMPRVQVVLRGPDAGALVPGVSSYGATEYRRTDDLGRFRFPDLAPGGYDVRVQPPDVPELSEVVDLPSGTAVVERSIVVGARRALAVRVTDESGTPVTRAIVTLADVAGSALGAQTWKRTGDDGVARFVGLPRQVQAMARAPAGASLLPTGLRDVPAEVAELTLVLRAARSLRVRLLDPSGRGIARATLRISRPGEIEWWVATNPSGEFTTLVPASGASLEFAGVIDGAESGWSARCDALPDGEEVTLRAEATPTDRTLRVRVESPDGEPIAGARVIVTHRLWQRQPESVSDTDGVAAFQGLPARSLRVTATNVGDWVQPARLEVVPAGQDVVLRARRGVAVRGTLLRPGGEPVRGRVTVRLSTGFGDFEDLTSRESDATGRFTLLVPEGVAGPFDISAHAEIDRLDIDASATGVSAGDDVRLTLRPAPPR